MHYDVHTHRSYSSNDVICIENVANNFNRDFSDRRVSLGLHPWYLNEETIELEFKSLEENVQRSEVLAIGECGLDKLTPTDWDLQLFAFRKQIGLANRIGKPILIHCVRAFNETLLELNNAAVPVIFHGVNNKRTIIQPVIKSGHFLSFGKSLLSSKEFIEETFRATPLDRIFLETDDSDADIGEIYKSAARIKNITEKEIVLQLENNFMNVFQF